MVTSPRPRIFGLDALRALAILCVVVSHARFLLFANVPGIDGASLGGFVGVEIFFVLSGFLIGRILLAHGDAIRHPATLRQFWRRRWLRTLPNYALFVGVNLLLAALALGPAPRHLVTYLTFTQNWLHEVEPFFRESWSLALEEWFYLLVPALLAALLALRVRRGVAVAGLAVAGLVVPTLLRWVAVSAHDASWVATRTLVPLHLDAPMMGVMAAAVATWHPGAWARLRTPGLVAGLAALVLAVLTWDSTATDTSDWLRILHPNLTQVGTALLLPILASWDVATGRLADAVRAVAAWSYAWYLTNLPVLALSFGMLDPRRLTPVQAAAAAWLFLAGSLALAAVVYRWWERPWMERR